MIFRVFRAMRTMFLGTLVLGVLAIALGVTSTPVRAVEGINERINFQGRLLTKEGATVPDGFYNVEFRIYQDGDGQTAGNTTGSPAGTLEWTEAWLNDDGNGVKVRNGYFSVELGSVTAFGSSVDWNQDTLYLSINVGDTAAACTPFSSCNGDGEMLPMKRLSATPYALNAGKLGGRTADGFIQNNAGTPQAANISIQSADAADVAAVIQGAAGQTADIFQVKADSVATPLFAVSSAGSVTITPTSDASAALTVNSTTGTIFSASATQISLNEDTIVASGKTLTVSGDTATNIAGYSSPSEGAITYDTDNNQLLVYSNGKWKADSTDAIIVAASNSSQADKNAADYVADGDTVAAADGDQVQINAALTAAAGKKVVLLAGTYTADATILIPNNTTLAGVGNGTLIQLADIDATDNLIENTDQATGTGVVIKDLRLDGQKALNTVGTQHGIYLNNMGDGNGATAVKGATITGVVVKDFNRNGIYLFSSNNNIVSNNTTGANWEGIYLRESSNNTVSGNTTQNNYNSGLLLYSSTKNSVTGNVSEGNEYCGLMFLSSSNDNTVTGNNFKDNVYSGANINNSQNNIIANNVMSGSTEPLVIVSSSKSSITGNYVQGGVAGIGVFSSNTIIVSQNNIYDAGGATNNNAIRINDSDNTTVTGNNITDTSATTTNYAINIDAATSDNNYLADNRFSSTPGTSTIQDLGTGTVYANQPRAENGGQLTNRTANDVQAFTVQNASGNNAFTVDTSNDKAIATTFEATDGFAINGTDGATATCNAGEYLDGAVIQGGIVTGGTCTTAATEGNFVTLQATTPGTADVGNFYIDGTGIANILQATSQVYTTNLDTATAVALNIGATNASSVVIGKTDGSAGITLSSNTITAGTGTADTTLIKAAQTTADTAGTRLTIQGSTGNGTGSGGTVRVQGGTGGATNANGGDLELYGGTGVGSGVTGLVKINTATYATAATQNSDSTTSGINTNVTQTNVDNYGALVVNATGNAQSFTLGDPTLGANAAGRVIYVTAAGGSEDFTLIVNGGGTGNQIAMRANTTATMIWNGGDWTAAGASSSTTLQAAYDNTLQSAGGAELVVSSSGNTNGLTIRDSSTSPVNGRILAVQTSSAADLISVNSNVTEYASDAGAEVAGATDTSFPASTWSAISGATVSRHITAGDYIATGQGSVSVVTNTSAGSGVKNQLTTALTAKTTYNISFAVRLDSSSSSFTDLEAYYSADGSAASVSCINGKVVPTSVWSKVNCTFTAPDSGINSSNAIFIRQTGSGTSHTMYVDNLSVTIAADYNYATDGSVNDNTNFTTNWTSVGGATVTRDTNTGHDASDSARAVTTGANQGVRNKLSINPLEDTLYRVTVYAALGSGTFDTFTIRYSRDGGSSFEPCADYNTQTIATGSTYTKVTCYVETDATAATNPYVYFTQTDGTGRTFYVDTFSMSLSTITTPNVQIGGGTNGGPTTLFTLDRGASAPIASDNDALLGSMYYDTTLGKLQCYEADGWGACGSSPDNIITISPEYTNAVLHGPSGGATGVGTMTSDICSDALDINDADDTSGEEVCGTNETYNFYKWTSPQATNQTYGIYVTYQLPDTFKQFASGQTSIMGRTDVGPSSGTASVSYKVYRNNSSTGLTQCGASAVSVSSGAVSSWQIGVATGAQDPSTCGFAAGDSIVFEIDVSAYQNANAYVGNLNFTFSNR